MRKNIKSLQEKLKYLERVLKEARRDFYVEFGKAVEREIQSGNVDERVKKIYEKLKNSYGV